MVTFLFIVGYMAVALFLSVIVLIHWVYTGVYTLAWADNILTVMSSRLFLQILIPIFFTEIIVRSTFNVLDKIRK